MSIDMTEDQERVILFLDDEEAILMSFQRLLRKEPYLVLCTTDPQEALRWIAERPIQLIISDYQMELMNGVEFVRKAHEIAPQCMKVVYSGYAHEAEIDRALEEKVLDRFISKPWDPKLVKEDLKKMLEECQLRPSKAA